MFSPTTSPFGYSSFLKEESFRYFCFDTLSSDVGRAAPVCCFQTSGGMAFPPITPAMAEATAMMTFRTMSQTDLFIAITDSSFRVFNFDLC